MCPLLLLPGFTIWRVHFDIMHSLDLGVYQSVLPSVMWQLVLRKRGRCPFRGTTYKAKFLSAYRQYKLWAKRNKIVAVARNKFKFKQWRKDSASRRLPDGGLTDGGLVI